MEKKDFYTLRELSEIFNLRPSHINYLKMERIIPSIRRGAGYPVLFPKEAIEIIKNRLGRTKIISE